MTKILVILCLLWSTVAFADQLIIEPDMGREPLFNAIHDAHHSLHLVMYGFTDEPLLNAFIQQKQYGRSVKFLLEHHPYKSANENIKTIHTLLTNHMDLQGEMSPFRFIHQKTLIIDGRKAIVMTFNFTKSTFKQERNFALEVDNPVTVNEIESVFSSDWNHKPALEHLPDLIYSPDNSRAKLTKLFNDARHSIKIYAQTISDYKMIGVLASAASRGVDIEILTSANIHSKQANYLQKAGVKLYQSHHYYIHAKVFIIDDQIAVLGSINLTRASLDDNRELSIITRDPIIIKQLRKTFSDDILQKTPYALLRL